MTLSMLDLGLMAQNLEQLGQVRFRTEKLMDWQIIVEMLLQRDVLLVVLVASTQRLVFRMIPEVSRDWLSIKKVCDWLRAPYSQFYLKTALR